MAIDASDQIYLGFNDFENAYIEKLSPQSVLLETIIQQHVRMISSVSVDNQGNIYSAGGCAEFNSAFAGVPVPAPFTYTTYLAKYDADGVFQWVKYVEDITCPEPQVKAVIRTPFISVRTCLAGSLLAILLQKDQSLVHFGRIHHQTQC
jgi:hypothetical protein